MASITTTELAFQDDISPTNVTPAFASLTQIEEPRGRTSEVDVILEKLQHLQCVVKIAAVYELTTREALLREMQKEVLRIKWRLGMKKTAFREPNWGLPPSPRSASVSGPTSGPQLHAANAPSDHIILPPSTYVPILQTPTKKRLPSLRMACLKQESSRLNPVADLALPNEGDDMPSTGASSPPEEPWSDRASSPDMHSSQPPALLRTKSAAF